MLSQSFHILYFVALAFEQRDDSVGFRFSADSSQEWVARVFWLALIVDATLVALHLLAPVWAGRTVGVFDLNTEGNLPTWWSSGKLAWAGILFAIVALCQRTQGLSYRFVGLLAVVLVAMSIDETASIHEKIGGWVDGATRRQTTFAKTGYWFVFLGVPVAIAVGVFLLYARRQLSAVPFTAARLALGFFTLFSGALAVEMFANFVESYTVMSRLQVALEEGLEMVGGTILLWAGAVFFVSHPSMQGLVNHAPNARTQLA